MTGAATEKQIGSVCQPYYYDLAHLEISHADLESWRAEPAGTVAKAIEAEIAAVPDWYPEYCGPEAQGEQTCKLTIRRVYDQRGDDVEDNGEITVTIDVDRNVVTRVEGWYYTDDGAIKRLGNG